MKNWKRAALAVAAVIPLLAYPATEPANDIRQVSLSEGHGCAVTVTGALRCFGRNDQGQVGTGTRVSSPDEAVQVIADGVSAAATGEEHTCAVRRGALLCWGDNRFGQLGTGKIGGISAQARTVIVSGVTGVAAGGHTTCAIVRGNVACWGRNDEGQVREQPEPSAVARPTVLLRGGVTAVAVGRQHACAIVRGTVKCWGFLGSSDFAPRIGAREFLAEGATSLSVADHTCAVVKSALWCWGSNYGGQLGLPDAPAFILQVPARIIAAGVTAVAAGRSNTCAIVDSALYCWGSNYNQFGARLPPVLKAPERVIDHGVTAVAVGEGRVCAVVEGLLQCTRRKEDKDAAPQDWAVFGAANTPFGKPRPVPPPPPRVAEYGLWRGTIGQQAMIAMLVPPGCTSSYYYLRHSWGIALQEQERLGQVWTEGNGEKPPRWTFEASEPGTLRGRWSDGEGRQERPIRLQRVAALKASDAACITLSTRFNAPRLAALQPLFAPQKFGARRYRSAAYLHASVVGFDLAEEAQGHPGFRRAMEEWVQATAADFYDCQTMLGSRFDPRQLQSFYVHELKPVIWTDRLLVLRETYSAECGGAPSFGTAGHVVWDLESDHAVDPWKWIRGRKDSFTVPDALHRLIVDVGARGRDSECSEWVQETRMFWLYPAGTGLVFVPILHRNAFGCEDPTEIPLARLRPHLTREGVEALQRLLD